MKSYWDCIWLYYDKGDSPEDVKTELSCVHPEHSGIGCELEETGECKDYSEDVYKTPPEREG